MRHLISLTILVVVVLTGPSAPAAAANEELHDDRHLTVDDLFSIRGVDDPRISPDGAWVASTVTGRDLDEDESSRS